MARLPLSPRRSPLAAGHRPPPPPPLEQETTHPPEGTGPSAAAADVVGPHVAARPEPEPDKDAEAAETASQAPRDEDLRDTAAGVTEEGELVHQTSEQGAAEDTAAGVTGAKEGELVHQVGEQGAAEAVAAKAAAKLQLEITNPVNQRFVPVKDVKTMLQTGLFEGKRIVYRNKRDKIDLLHGVIKGTSYYCLCGGYCDKTDKELTAKSFEMHAKGDSHNPNDHIFVHPSSISLYEMSKRFKDEKDGSVQAIFDSIMKPSDPAHSVKKVTTLSDMAEASGKKVATASDMPEDHPTVKRLQMLEERMDQFEKKVDLIDQMQSQINTIEANVEFLVNSTVRLQKLFEEVSKVFGKFSEN